MVKDGGRDERERVWGEQMKEQGWKREKTDRTDMLLSLGVNKRALSSQSFAVCAEATGDPWLCVLFVTVRQSCAHLHTTASLALYS